MKKITVAFISFCTLSAGSYCMDAEMRMKIAMDMIKQGRNKDAKEAIETTFLKNNYAFWNYKGCWSNSLQTNPSYMYTAKMEKDSPSEEMVFEYNPETKQATRKIFNGKNNVELEEIVVEKD